MVKNTRKRIQSLLSEFHGESVGCDMAAVVDLSSGIVLCTSEQTSLPQDRLDQVAAAFNDPTPDPAAEALRVLDDTPGFVAVARHHEGGVAVSVTDPAALDEAVICRFADTPEIDGVRSLARAISALAQSAGEAA